MKYKLSEDGKKLLTVYEDMDTFIIPDSVEVIGMHSFGECIINNVIATNVKVINYKAFNNSSIKTIIAPKCLIIHENAFGKCINLESFDAININTIDMNAFQHCSKLKYINIPNCTYIAQNAFWLCEKLSKINSKLTNEQLREAFSDIQHYNNYIQRIRELKLNTLNI